MYEINRARGAILELSRRWFTRSFTDLATVIIYHRHPPPRLKRENDLSRVNSMRFPHRGWKEHAFPRRRARQRGTDGQKKMDRRVGDGRWPTN